MKLFFTIVNVIFKRHYEFNVNFSTFSSYSHCNLVLFTLQITPKPCSYLSAPDGTIVTLGAIVIVSFYVREEEEEEELERGKRTMGFFVYTSMCLGWK